MVKRSPFFSARLIGAVAVVVVLLLIHVGVGSSMWLSPVEVLRELVRGNLGSHDTANVVVWELRLPRALGCVLVGGILGATGAAFQAVFRNPLGEPYVIGVSSGAAVGGVLAFVFGWAPLLFGLGGVLLAVICGVGSLALVLALAQRRGLLITNNLLLAGVMVGLLLSSLMTMILLGSGADTNRVLRWLLGSMTPMFWERIFVLLVVSVLGVAYLIRETRRLNAVAMSEAAASQLGIEPAKLMQRVLLAGTVMTAAAVGAVGIIGFLGLVAPHLARRIVGPDLRQSLPMAAVFGAMLLLVADLIAQRGIPGQELPVGAVTALIGAPVLLALLRKSHLS